MIPPRSGVEWLSIVVLATAALAAGCTRTFYREQADTEVYCLVDHTASDPRWPLSGYTIDLDPRSRMFSPYDPDRPPMPPDDPTAHRYMHCVDCKHGYPCWHADGDTPYVANPSWEAYLPRNEQGELVIDLRGAVELSLLHSGDYQGQLEELYLSALDVTFERFRFDTQFFGGFETFFTADAKNRPGGGGRVSSELDVSVFPASNRLRAERMLAGGGELVVGLANSLVWEFSGTDSHMATSVLDFSIVQPLLRGGGRARVLERLTIAERTLLGNVRQMERFRRGFYAEIAVGRNAPPGPSRRGGVFGGSGLEGFTGVGAGGFGRVGNVGGGGITGGAGAAEAGGFLGLLQEVQQIRNQEANVAGLRDSVAQLQAAHEAGRIDRFQVDLARQALYNAQSVLLTRTARLQSSSDEFKIDLGLPPHLAVRIDDPMLDRFNLLDPELTAVQNRAQDMLEAVRRTAEAPAEEILATLAEIPAAAAQVATAARERLTVVEQDRDVLETNLPERRAVLRQLAQAGNPIGQLDATITDVDLLDRRAMRLEEDLINLAQAMETTLDQIQALETNAPGDLETARQVWIDALTALSEQLFELSLIQAGLRLDAVTVQPIDLEPKQALDIASVNRRDWMNARAELVNRWRLIEFNANDLKSRLDVVFSGDISNDGDNPLRFDDDTGRLRVGLRFDAPLTRLAERNLYRQSLIEYQDARRQYYSLVDRISQGLRETLRTIELNVLNFELRRTAVQVAISQVDLARLRLSRPPQPGETSTFGDTTARDLVQALSDLLNVQNDFLSVWVNYEVQRLSLDLDLGTMQLDDHGMWIDPGPDVGRAWMDPHETELELFDIPPEEVEPRIEQPL